MNTPLSHRIPAIILFAATGLIGLYPTALLMFASFDTIPAPTLFWLAWLTSLTAVITSGVTIYQAVKGRPMSTIVVILSALVALATLGFTPLSQHTSGGEDCASGCITTTGTIAPGLLASLMILYVVGVCALFALLLRTSGASKQKLLAKNKSLRNIVVITTLLTTLSGSLSLLFLLAPHYYSVVATEPYFAHPIIYSAALAIIACAVLVYTFVAKRPLSRISITIMTLFAVFIVATAVLVIADTSTNATPCNRYDTLIEPWNTCTPTLSRTDIFYGILFENIPFGIITGALAATSIATTLIRNNKSLSK